MILVVDDDEDTQKLLEKILSSKGYKVHGSILGNDAVEFCKTSTPELIFMDISLPHSDGFLIAQTIRALPQLNRVPIIAISALAMKGIKERVQQSACNDYLEKPFTPAKILTIVEQYCGKKTT